MPEIRETHVERDADGRVTDSRVTIDRPKKKGGFGWGMLFGVVILAAAIIGFAYMQGSFTQAGREADQATAQIETQTSVVAENAGDAIENAGDQAEQLGDQAEETSDTATN